MRLLATGRGGQVGTELAALGVEVVGRDAMDLSDPQACAAAIRDRAPEGVVNAAAYTAVDRAEKDEAAAATVNGDAPGAMAEACAAMGIPFVHLSTDYVFDGGGQTPWRPEDATAPIGAYGRTKLMGERGVRAAGGIHAILRTSWVFSAHGSNFVTSMLRLGGERDALRIVSDQVGGPTPARAIAAACVEAARGLTPSLAGTYHFAGAPDVSWAGFARAIFEEAGLDCAVEDIPSSDYPTPARRPLNSRLDCAATRDAFGIERPDWRADLRAILEELE